VWPLLMQRCPEQIVPLVRLMEDQHASVAATGRKVSEALAIWRVNAAPVARSMLAAALERLVPVLTEHLEVEEQRVVPAMELHISMGEWTEILQKGTAGVDLDGLPLLFGMLFYEGDPQVIDSVLATLPAEVRGGMRDRARQAYAARAEQIHGTATPPRSSQNLPGAGRARPGLAAGVRRRGRGWRPRRGGAGSPRRPPEPAGGGPGPWWRRPGTAARSGRRHRR
jgi:hypothetical protein